MGGNHLGSMCGVIPRRVGVMFVAVMSVVVGIAVILFMLWKALQATLRYHPHVGCDDGDGGTECGPKTYDVFTCAHSSKWTAEVVIWYVAVAITSSGYIGIRGIMLRSKAEIDLFAMTFLIQGLLILIISIVDLFYVDLCGHLPDSALHVLYAVVPEKMNLLFKMGNDPAKAPPADLQDVLGSSAIASIYISRCVSIIFSFYVAQQAYTLAELSAGGPCGLGPMYGLAIGSDLQREWKNCVDDLMESQKALVDEGDIEENMPISNLKSAGVGPPVTLNNGIDYLRHGSLYASDYTGYGTLA